jgi:hypothetical protein
MAMRIGFKVVEKNTNRHIGYVTDPLMNLTSDVTCAYTEKVSNPYEFKSRVRFFEKNLNTILGGKAVQLRVLCERIRNSNYKNFKEGELVVVAVYPSELSKS